MKKRQKKTLSKLKADPELQRALDAFPAAVKLKEKAAKERKRIMKNFLSVKNKIFPNKEQ